MRRALRCAACGGYLPKVGRSDRRFCSSKCRLDAWRENQRFARYQAAMAERNARILAEYHAFLTARGLEPTRREANQIIGRIADRTLLPGEKYVSPAREAARE